MFGFNFEPWHAPAHGYLMQEAINLTAAHCKALLLQELLRLGRLVVSCPQSILTETQCFGASEDLGQLAAEVAVQHGALLSNACLGAPPTVPTVTSLGLKPRCTLWETSETNTGNAAKWNFFLNAALSGNGIPQWFITLLVPLKIAVQAINPTFRHSHSTVAIPQLRSRPTASNKSRKSVNKSICRWWMQCSKPTRPVRPVIDCPFLLLNF